MGYAICSVFLLALLAPGLTRIAKPVSGWLMAALPLTLCVYFLSMLDATAGGLTLQVTWPWLPDLGIRLSFFLDGLSLLFAVLVCGVGAVIMIYSAEYLANHKYLGSFFLFLNLFMASMLGLVLADNLITLFVFWELTSLTSFFLIGFDHDRDKARSSALQALLVTGVGGLALLAGLILVGEAAGTLELSELLQSGDLIRQHAWYVPIVLLVATGAFAKSAQFPFHFWLPNAMEAPTPVSAYLHSATMVKAGIYLLLRLSPILGQTALWHGMLETVGGVTMLGSILMAIRQTDMKRLLAYTTISSLGTMVFLIGLDIPLSIAAAISYMLAHVLYKASLFLITGIIDHATGSRDLSALGGLFGKMPVIGLVAILAALSMAGAAPFLGFVGKELFYEVVLMAPRAAPLSILAALLTSIFMVTSAALLTVRPFFGPARSDRLPHGPVATNLWLGPLLLAGAGTLAGVFIGIIDKSLLAPAVSAVQPGHSVKPLALWHGFTPVLAFSILTLASGVAVYFKCDWYRAWTENWSRLHHYGAETCYERLYSGLFTIASRLTLIIQNGRLRNYLLTVFISATVLVSSTLLWNGGIRFPTSWTSVNFGDLILAGIILAAAFVTSRVGHRLVAIVAMGVIGYGIALIFAQLGAPDLAMTQFSIETMTVLLFILIFHRLPLFSRLAPRRAMRFDAVVATAAGLLMTALTLAAVSGPTDKRLADFFAKQSVPAAHGRNIVNTILVDFRALDTLGEIAVLGMAGVGVWALLKLWPKERRKP
jgi:multicomponent Na+:H+ antiporter subunit A